MTESERTAFETLARLCSEARGVRKPDPGAGTPSIPEPERFTDLCRRHKVTATAYRGLVARGIDPSLPWMTELKREAYSSLFFRKAILIDLAELVTIFTAANLRFVVLKGPATSMLLYGDPLVREYTDLDILVDLDEASAIAPLIASAGYSSEELREPGELPGIASRPHHVVFWKKGRNHRVEIHDRMGWQREIYRREPHDLVFSQAIKLDTGDFQFPAPRAYDQASLILTHGSHHAWSQLHWILDFAALANPSPGALPDLRATVRDLLAAPDTRTQWAVAHAVARGAGILAVDTAPSLLDAESSTGLTGSKIERLAKFALDRLMYSGADTSRFGTMLKQTMWYEPALLCGFEAKARAATSLLLIPPKDLDALPLPRHLGFLHFIARPFFVAGRRINRALAKAGLLHTKVDLPSSGSGKSNE